MNNFSKTGLALLTAGMIITQTLAGCSQISPTPTREVVVAHRVGDRLTFRSPNGNWYYVQVVAGEGGLPDPVGGWGRGPAPDMDRVDPRQNVGLTVPLSPTGEPMLESDSTSQIGLVR